MISAVKNVYKNLSPIAQSLTGKKLNIDWKTEKPIDNLVLKKFASKLPDLEKKVNTIKPFLYIIQCLVRSKIFIFTFVCVYVRVSPPKELILAGSGVGDVLLLASTWRGVGNANRRGRMASNQRLKTGVLLVSGLSLVVVIVRAKFYGDGHKWRMTLEVFSHKSAHDKAALFRDALLSSELKRGLEKVVLNIASSCLDIFLCGKNSKIVKRNILNLAAWNVHTLLDKESRHERRTAIVARELASFGIDKIFCINPLLCTHAWPTKEEKDLFYGQLNEAVALTPYKASTVRITALVDKRKRRKQVAQDESGTGVWVCEIGNCRCLPRIGLFAHMKSHQ
ncbi:hypothetical protein HELRODRAFT_169167 [Helobdella robusta]|uniref:C2H2-type domain-containing protein n=1 Tax=Helobdella robusta TaxID=6412 RepID=T1F1I5_HELRO|nr:hypothetical protein HELRODRAFT_169167 [Helobdella robusta]ESO08354.1 hypothetical protein HELRODRAFT_169167 [Helobdella robusta]